MQVTFLDQGQSIDYLAECEVLATLEGNPGMTTYVLEHDGSDVLMVMGDFAGSAVVIYPAQMFDAEWGGSIHDDARAAIRSANAANDDSAQPAA